MYLKNPYFCRMIKHFVWLFSVLFLLQSCNKTFENALKSDDPQYILQIANQMYEEDKWDKALELYQKISANFAGTSQAEDIAWRGAYANFYDKNYPLAAKQFKNFFLGFNKSERAEEALYMSAFSYYKGSPEYNLDQSNTIEAMKELQGFIDVYPNSKRVAEANRLISELRYKLEQKYFEIAKSYFTTLYYKSAANNFANFIDDYPDSHYREEAYMYLMKSKAELALQSIFDKKELRLKDAITTYLLFSKNYPNSKYSTEAKEYYNKLESELKNHQRILKNNQ